MLSLLPVERVDAAAVEPRVERAAQLRLAAEPGGERDLADLDLRSGAGAAQRAELVQLPQAVQPVAGAAFARDDEPGRSRYRSIRGDQPVRLRRFSDGQRIGRTLPQACQGSARP